MPRTRQNRVALAAASMAIVGGVFSLLIWGKLRLVGPVPRSAYAEPAPEPAPANTAEAPSATENSALPDRVASPGDAPETPQR